MRERIKLDDFLSDAIKALEIPEEDIPKLVTRTRYFCTECKTTYSDVQFCTRDGAKIESETYEVESEDADDFVRDIFWNLTETEIPDNFPYKYIDSIEKRGDGSGYYLNYIFQRKSDDKFFYYTSYDGRIEQDTLDETTQEVKVRWSFENSFD